MSFGIEVCAEYPSICLNRALALLVPTKPAEFGPTGLAVPAALGSSCKKVDKSILAKAQSGN
jgi:hypothetical protein